MSDDFLAELASIAASLRAYLEVQEDTGAWGIPRATKGSVSTPAATPPHLASVSHGESSSPGASTVHAAVAVAVAWRRSLEVVRDVVSSCEKCVLSQTRKSTVFARGNPAAKLCFVGEAPGADEDEQGVPFVGKAGQLLDKMIAAMGLSPESDVYICNIIKCRPPGNRTPLPEEISACIPYLHEQLESVDPKVIVAMGNTAVSALLGTTIGITKLRSQWKLYKGRTLVMPTYHPSYLVREGPQQQQNKREAWEDLQKVMKELGLSKRS